MARFRNKRTWDIEEPIINLTPLIDVVFVILIMFILIAPMLDVDRIDLADGNASPIEGSIAVQESSPITVHVFSDNSIQFNGRIVTEEELASLLQKAREMYPEARPQIFHDKRAHFGTYQGVKNAAESAGFSTMDIVLKPG
jgi:biopolymer transport protein ExbD